MMDEITLPSGRRIYANRGILGVDAEGSLFGGYDNGLHYAVDYDELGPEDVVAVADIALQRWAEVKAQAQRSAALDELGKLDGELMAKEAER